jgi:cellulose synthase (UDP-forming)
VRTIEPADPRLANPDWQPTTGGGGWRATILALIGTVAATAYLAWLLHPARVGNPLLYGVLVLAELVNVVQALGFWWTCARRRPRRTAPPTPGVVGDAVVDVLIPTYNEPVDVVEPTVVAATALRGAEVRVAVLDDGDRPEIEAMARRCGARYLRRTVHSGAKAGNVNHALRRTSAPFVVVLDCDHVPRPEFLERTLPYFSEPGLAFVQTPQFYANHGDDGIASAAWSQQALFFGPIAAGKDALGAMFCCGTNVVFRRVALVGAGGFPEGSLTEDFELSVTLHEHGWTSAYVPEVLACGLGPEDLASYVSQQQRWARGCLATARRVVTSHLRWRLKAQYLLSSLWFTTGLTALVYLSLPVIRLLTGLQPVAGASADRFLLYFGPYFGLALATLAVVGAGTYAWRAYALAFATWWIHAGSVLSVLLGRRGSFVVTPKRASGRRELRPALPTLLTIGVLVAVAFLGLARDRSPATLNNVAFAVLHAVVLSSGIRPALVSRAFDAASSGEQDEAVAAA